MSTAAPEPPAGDLPGAASVQPTGVSHDSSTFTPVAGDQYTVHLPPDPPGSARCTLPVDTAAFTGRTRELEGIAGRWLRRRKRAGWWPSTLCMQIHEQLPVGKTVSQPMSNVHSASTVLPTPGIPSAHTAGQRPAGCRTSRTDPASAASNVANGSVSSARSTEPFWSMNSLVKNPWLSCRLMLGGA